MSTFFRFFHVKHLLWSESNLVEIKSYVLEGPQNPSMNMGNILLAPILSYHKGVFNIGSEYVPPPPKFRSTRASS